MRKKHWSKLEEQWAEENAHVIRAIIDCKTSEDLVNEIQRSIFFDFCVKKKSWTMIVTENTVDDTWMEQNIHNGWTSSRRRYAFESPKEAVIFALRWS